MTGEPVGAVIRNHKGELAVVLGGEDVVRVTFEQSQRYVKAAEALQAAGETLTRAKVVELLLSLNCRG